MLKITSYIRKYDIWISAVTSKLYDNRIHTCMNAYLYTLTLLHTHTYINNESNGHREKKASKQRDIGWQIQTETQKREVIAYMWMNAKWSVLWYKFILRELNVYVRKK